MAKKKKGVLLGKARFGDGEIYWLVQVEGEKRPQLYMEKDIPNLPIDISTNIVFRAKNRYYEKGIWPSSDSEAAMAIEQAVYADDNLDD